MTRSSRGDASTRRKFAGYKWILMGALAIPVLAGCASGGTGETGQASAAPPTPSAPSTPQMGPLVTLIGSGDEFTVTTPPATAEGWELIAKGRGCTLKWSRYDPTSDITNVKEGSEAALLSIPGVDSTAPLSNGLVALDGDPKVEVEAGMNVAVVEWSSGEGSAIGAARASLVPEFDGGQVSQGVLLLLECGGGDASAVWNDLLPSIRIGLWVGGPERLGEWPQG